MTHVNSGITVPGTAGGNIVVSLAQDDYLDLARQMATVLNTLRTNSQLSITTVAAGAAVPPSGSNLTSELGVTGKGGAQTFAGSKYNYVVDVTSSSDTIQASNSQVISNNIGRTIFVDGISTVAATGGNNFVNAQGNFVVSTGTGDDTVVASGSGTIAAGAGANQILVGGQGGSQYVIAVGKGDNVTQDSSKTNTAVLMTGTNSNVVGSSNTSSTLNITLGGSNNNVFQGGALTSITVTGTNDVVVGGDDKLPSAMAVLLGGSNNNVYQGAAQTGVTVSGTQNAVIGSDHSKSGTLSVLLSGSVNSAYSQSSQAQITITGSGNTVIGGTKAGSLTVLDTGDTALILQQDASVLSATVSGNSSQIQGASSKNTTFTAIVSGSNDTVGVGAGTSFVTVSGSGALVSGTNDEHGNSEHGRGTLTLLDSGNNGTITNRSVNTTATISGSGNVVYGGNGTLAITVSGSNDTVYAGTGPTTVTTSSNALVFGPVSGTLRFIGGAGLPTIIGSSGGSELATVGSGGLFFAAGTNNNSTITSGLGQATIFGGDGSVVNFNGSLAGGASFHANAGGNETLSAAGSSTHNIFFANTIGGSNTNFAGGIGQDTMVAGAGSITMTGGAGQDLFVLFKNDTGPNARVTITDFASNESIYILGYDSTKSASSLQDNATGKGIAGTGAGITLTLSDNTTVTFSNLTNVHQLDGKILYG